MKMDEGAVNGYMLGLIVVITLGYLMLIGVGFCNASRSKYNVENAQVEAGFAGFRSSENYYVNEGNLQLDRTRFDQSYQSFLSHLKKNLNLTNQNDGSRQLMPQEGSYFPCKDHKGNPVYGEVQEYIMYVVNSGSVTDPGKIQYYKSVEGNVQQGTSSGVDISYAGETVLRVSDLTGASTDNCLILCTKVKYPQTTILSDTTYFTKTCVVRWKSGHKKK